MDEIIEIQNSKVKIGQEDGTVLTVPIAAIKFENPKVGDRVKVYKDGDDYIINKATSTFSTDDLISDHKVNKHLFVWVFCFFLGGFGVDRFIRGQIGVGVCKLLFNWLTLGIWSLVDFIIALVKAYGSGDNGEMLEFDEQGNYID